MITQEIWQKNYDTGKMTYENGIRTEMAQEKHGT